MFSGYREQINHERIYKNSVMASGAWQRRGAHVWIRLHYIVGVSRHVVPYLPDTIGIIFGVRYLPLS